MAATTIEINSHLIAINAIMQDMIDALGFNSEKRWVRTDLELDIVAGKQTTFAGFNAIGNDTGTRTAGALAALTADVNPYITLLKTIEPLFMAQVEALNNKDWSEVRNLRALTASSGLGAGYKATIDAAGSAVGNIGGSTTENGADQTGTRVAFGAIDAVLLELDTALGYRLEKNWDMVEVSLATATTLLASVPSSVTNRS